MNRHHHPPRRMRRAALLAALVAAVPALAAAAAARAAPSAHPVIGAAKMFSLAGFEPATTVVPGKPDDRVVHDQAAQRQAADPLQDRIWPAHRRAPDHRPRRPRLHHPPAPAGRTRRPAAPDGHVPRAGALPRAVDAYPNIPGGQPNFQLFQTVNVKGAYHPKALPPFSADQTVDGYHMDMQGHPTLHAIQAQFVARRRDRSERAQKVTFVPWFGALAHAIFFHQGIAGLLPHAHLRPQRSQLRRAPWRHRKPRGRNLHGPGQAHDRRAATGAGNLAAVLADEARRQAS